MNFFLVPSYYGTHHVLVDDCNYRNNDNENNKEFREVSFKRRPDFENSESYSLVDHPMCVPHPSGVNDGNVKTHLSILVNNNLNSIHEDISSPTAPKTAILLSPKKRTHVNGVHELKRRSIVHLSDDLATESTDVEVTNIDSHKEAGILLPTSPKSPVRNYASIYVSSPIHRNNLAVSNNDSNDLYNAGNLHQFQVDIPLTPSVQSSSNTSDDISSLSSNSSGTSSVTVSSAIMIRNQTSSKELCLVNDDSIPTNGKDLTENLPEDKASKEVHVFLHETNAASKGECPNKEVRINGTDVPDGGESRLTKLLVIEENKNDLVSEVKANGGIKTSPFKQARRRSSGYIPYIGDIRQDMRMPECLIRDDITVKHAIEDNQSHEQIKTRKEACDHTLTTFNSLKTKLAALKQSSYSVRTNNKIMQNEKQSMSKRIDILNESIEQLEDLTAAESAIVAAILETKSSLSHITESCTRVYNAQYSMKHFTSKLIDCIDKHIDVLITTDSWSATPVSNLTMEIHNDKCELVHDSLQSLRKTINKL